MKSLVLSILMLATSAMAHDLQTVNSVDIKRYMGLWYEIGRYENSFQRKCGETTALYKLKKNGKVSVTNTCKRIDKPGKLQVAKATAIVKDKKTNAKLSVSFVPILRNFGLFGGKYWILALNQDADDYEYVLVGEPSRKFLWILSRTPKMDPNTYQMLLDIAEEKGFDASKVRLSPTWQD